MLRKIEKAISNPEIVLPYFLSKMRAIIHLTSEGRIGEAIAYTPTIPGIDTYTPYLRLKSTDGLIKREILGNEMYLDPLDKGISQDLLVWGVREELPVQAFICELKKLSEEVDEKVTVVDIGTNIGYFLLIESNILGDSGDIHTIEPHPRNRWLSLKNIKLNDLKIEVQEGAIGATTETVDLYISDGSNRHRVNDKPIGGEYTDILKVPQWTLDDFVKINDIDPAQVNVLRMDVEGYETQVFDGMTTVLNTASPLLIFLELHSKILSYEDLNKIISKLIENDFRIVGAFYDPPLLTGRKLELSNFEDIYELSHDVQLLVKRS